MQDKAKEVFEFNPDKLDKVSIDQVRENTWNPKDPDAPEYEKIKESIRINGLTQPVFVRENPDDDTLYEILDGANRFRACVELGFKEIYIYNEGEVPDALAKSFTLFHQVQNPFIEADLAPLVVELNELEFKLPYSDKELEDFKNLVAFDFNSDFQDLEPIDEGPKMKTLSIKMTPEQFEVVDNALKTVREGENVNDGRALELLVASGLSQYPFDGTGTLQVDD